VCREIASGFKEIEHDDENEHDDGKDWRGTRKQGVPPCLLPREQSGDASLTFEG
jgi:hypothetical protein